MSKGFDIRCKGGFTWGEHKAGESDKLEVGNDMYVAHIHIIPRQIVIGG